MEVVAAAYTQRRTARRCPTEDANERETWNRMYGFSEKKIKGAENDDNNRRDK